MSSTATPAKVSLRNVRSATAASIRNEQVTRARVDHLESFAGAVSASVTETQKQLEATTHVVGQHMDFLQMGFMGRLRWLVTGALPQRTPDAA